MDKQIKEAREMVKNLSFRDKVEHFFEYYKLHTIVAVIAVIMIATTVYQVSTRIDYDFEVGYYGASGFTDEHAQKLAEYLSGVVEDVNGDGEVNVRVTVVGSAYATQDFQMQVAMNQKFMAELSTDTYDAYLFDNVYYSQYGPATDIGLFETSITLNDSENLSNVLTLGEEPVYWCSAFVHEKDEQERQKILYNQKLAESAL